MELSLQKKLEGLWDIIRPIDDVVMGIGLIVGMVLAGSVEQGIPWVFYVYVFFAGFFVTAHAMVVNDIADIEIDKINEPNRVLPKGVISVSTAWIYAGVLAALGIFFFLMIDLAGYDKIPYLWLYGLFHVALADFYTYRLKETGFIGNIVVAWTAYALFLGADLFLNGHLTLIPQIIGVMAFCADLSREIFKGIIDQEGDRQHGVRTIAVVLGPRKAKYIASFIFSICLALVIYAFPRLFLIGKIGMVVVGILFSYVLYLSKDAEKPQQSRKIKTYILMGPLISAPFLIFDRIFPISIL